MSNTLKAVGDFLTTFPSDAENGLYLIPPAVAALGITAVQSLMFWKKDEQRHTIISNPAALKAIKHNRVARYRRAVLPSTLAVTGLLMAGGTVAAGFETDSIQHTGNGAVELIDPTENSMRYTQDLGTPDVSRRGAVLSGLLRAKFNGKLGVVEPQDAPEQPITSLHLTYQWHKQRQAIKTPKADSNSASLFPAINMAVTELEGDNTNKVRTVIVPTDGIIADPNQVRQAVTQAETQGINFKFMLVGTPTGTYRYAKDAPVTDSSIRPDTLYEAVPAADQSGIQQAATAPRVEAMVAQDLSEVGSRRTHRPAGILTLTALVLTGAGVAGSWLQGARRYN